MKYNNIPVIGFVTPKLKPGVVVVAAIGNPAFATRRRGRNRRRRHGYVTSKAKAGCTSHGTHGSRRTESQAADMAKTEARDERTGRNPVIGKPAGAVYTCGTCEIRRIRRYSHIRQLPTQYLSFNVLYYTCSSG
ncbi:hypothetical protein PUN28_007333 [Cardiocondyla obscurior]|uniref:Ribosomal protein L14 n=1 Tax=Cardiocondyla obscurior TaxID=286306 RepID=A0AAW2G5P0_9HYME